MTRPWLPALFVGVLLLAVPHTWQSGDAYTYLADAALGEQLVHPHHLIYNVVLCTGSIAGLDGVLLVARVHAALVACLAMLFVWRALVATEVPQQHVAPLLWALALTRAVVGDLGLYTPYGGLLMGSALVAWGMAARRPWLTAAGCVVAFVYHQTGVLLLVPAIVALRARSLPLVAAFATMAGAQVLGWLVQSPSRDLFSWTVLYAQGSNPSWGNQLHQAYLAPLSFARQVLWIGSGSMRWLLLPVGVGAIAVLWALRSRWREALPWLVWSVVHLGFFAWWMPTWRWFFTPALVPAVLLVALAKPPPRLVWGVALLMGAYNLPTAWWLSVSTISEEAHRADHLAEYQGPCVRTGSRWTVEALRVRTHGHALLYDAVPDGTECVVLVTDEVHLAPPGRRETGSGWVEVWRAP